MPTRAGRKTGADFVLIEIGGTIGEYQNILYLEAARMMKLQRPKDILFILVSYLPIPKIIGEMKTKPTQMASRLLNEAVPAGRLTAWQQSRTRCTQDTAFGAP